MCTLFISIYKIILYNSLITSVKIYWNMRLVPWGFGFKSPCKHEAASGRRPLLYHPQKPNDCIQSIYKIPSYRLQHSTKRLLLEYAIIRKPDGKASVLDKTLLSQRAVGTRFLIRINLSVYFRARYCVYFVNTWVLLS